MKVIVNSLISLWLLGGCAAKTIYLPKDAGVYFKNWQDTVDMVLQCEEDLSTLQDACNKLMP